MHTHSFMRKVAAVMGVLAATLVMAGAARAQDSGYVTIDPPQATSAAGKIEVLEFFQYGCPHCRVMEPLVAAWAKTLQDDVSVQRVPVAFNAAMAAWQRLYFSLEALGRLDLHAAVFKTVQDERKHLTSRGEVIEWAQKQGLDKEKFSAMYDSFGVGTKVNRANQLIKAYNLDSVPAMVVNGSYMTSPALSGGYQQTVDVADSLVTKVRGAS